MSDKQDSSKLQSEQAKPEDKETKQHGNKCKSLSCIGLGLLLLILVACVALVSYVFWQNQTQHDDDLQSFEQNKSSISNLQQDLQQQQQALSDQQQQLTQVISQQRQQDQDWILAEVQYLLQQANFALQFEQNIAVSLALLNSADQQLQSLANPKILTLRQAITEDMAELKAVKQFDAPGTLLKISALSGQVAKMPSISVRGDEQQETADAEEDDKQSTWQRALDESWQTLKQIVVVQHHDKPVSPLIATSNKAYLDQHLQLLLSQVQWAVMQKQAELYHQSLNDAYTWTKQYYDTNAGQTKAMLDTLEQLNQLDPAPQIPDIEKSITALDAVEKSRGLMNGDTDASSDLDHKQPEQGDSADNVEQSKSTDTNQDASEALDNSDQQIDNDEAKTPAKAIQVDNQQQSFATGSKA